MRIHQRHNLKNKDIRRIKNEIASYYGEELAEAVFGRKAKVEWIKTGEYGEIIAADGRLCFFKNNDRYIPFLGLLLERPEFPGIPSVTVDKGAVPYVVKGADVMRPGITEIDDSISEGDTVIIREENYKKPLAVGIALYGAEDMREMKKGKVIRNIHHISDKLWEFAKEFNRD